ncbi:MAG: hypothetical protein JXR91_02565 [Deltaproteobacteria bacterium]|nr:hypothetical protein [Deltaproteobacteria bacterium]
MNQNVFIIALVLFMQLASTFLWADDSDIRQPTIAEAEPYKAVLGERQFKKSVLVFTKKAPEGMSYHDFTISYYERRFRRGKMMITAGALLTSLGGLGVGLLISNAVKNRRKSEESATSSDEEDNESHYPDFSPLLNGFVVVGYIFIWALASLAVCGGVALVIVGILKAKNAKHKVRQLNSIPRELSFQVKFSGTGLIVEF